MSAPLPQIGVTFEAQQPITLIAQCIFGEARSEGLDAKLGVGHVLANRVKAGHFGQGFAGVILKSYQFSCFNHDDPNRMKLMEPTKYESPTVWEECYRAAATIYGGHHPDITLGAVFYFSPPLFAAPHAWGNVRPTVKIGSLSFYALA